MPVTPTYPGVYIEEIPSGVRTITGVATSITAFVGRALRGPTDEPITINNYGDFERIFGGLWVESQLGFQVRNFFLNGGSQAIIVRVFQAGTPAPAPPPAEPPGGETPTPAVSAAASTDAGKARIDSNGLEFIAANPGAWGNYLRTRIDHDVSADVALRFGLDGASDLFNLTVRDTQTGFTEQFRNLSVQDSPRRVDKVLENESDLVRLVTPLTGTTPVPTPHADAPSDPTQTIWEDDNTSSPSDDGGSNGAAIETADIEGSENDKTGMYALKDADLFNILCIPPYYADYTAENVSGLFDTAAKFCEDNRAFLMVDSPPAWNSKDDAKAGLATDITTRSNHAALFFPMLKQPNPLRDNQMEEVAPCGAVAGIFSRTDAQRGVWKAPAGLEARFVGVPQLSVPLTDDENGELNPLGINCLRTKPAAGRVVWGARTLEGDDRLASEWKYIPVRRLALFIEESLYRGTQWAVFEPNDDPLWAQLRLNIGAFMQNLFRQGAFQGSSPRDAYLVKCDSETTTQNDINLGIVNVIVGFAPLKPAEFVILKIQQLAGQIET
ncbi:MAG: phage tail sheath family protein [Leptolyngbya sp. SIO1D8]|nr:phage tail sheath family protein [Leptolyngbya sp. SIO1D8]